MKLSELKALVDRAVETSRDYEDHEVVNSLIYCLYVIQNIVF